jgi:hypothetical protein
MNTLKIESNEDKSRSTTATVARSIARTTVCLVIMVLAAASSFARLASENWGTGSLPDPLVIG